MGTEVWGGGGASLCVIRPSPSPASPGWVDAPHHGTWLAVVNRPKNPSLRGCPPPSTHQPCPPRSHSPVWGPGADIQVSIRCRRRVPQKGCGQRALVADAALGVLGVCGPVRSCSLRAWPLEAPARPFARHFEHPLWCAVCPFPVFVAFCLLPPIHARPGSGLMTSLLSRPTCRRGPAEGSDCRVEP